MRDDNANTRAAQTEIRRELDRRGIALKVAAARAKVPLSTFMSWFPAPGGEREPQVMSIAGLSHLAGAIPDDLLSLLLPDGFHMVRAPEGVDYDAACEAMRAYIDAKERAHHPDSEDGREIGPSEDGELGKCLSVVRERAA